MSNHTESAAPSAMTADQARYVARRKPLTSRERDMNHEALRVLARSEGTVLGVECEIARPLTSEELAIVCTEIEGANRVRVPALAKIAAALEAECDRVRPLASSDDAQVVGLALLELMGQIGDALDVLRSIGGRASNQDVADAACAVRMGRLRDSLVQRFQPLAEALPPIAGGSPDDLTPIEVLAASAPRFEPSESDWQDYADWCDGRLTEADHLVSHGC